MCCGQDPAPTGFDGGALRYSFVFRHHCYRPPFTVRRLLFAVRRLLFAVYHSLFVVYCLPFTVRRLPFAVRRLLFVVCR